jgi:molecular chaperone HtpG
MRIPERFEQKLQADKSVRSSVDAAIADFVPWLEDSKLPFFPDYTDHGTRHVEDILVTASSLISDEAWEAVTAQDVAVLILSALLHDCAMHITEDGFDALVGGHTHTTRVTGFGDADWPALWQEFLFSAKRFDDRALTDLFGEPRPVRTPPPNPNEMTRADRVLIGEFLRRHHPRLAHEIALRGVPGPTDRPLTLSERLDPQLANLAGLIARSHGLSLRATFDYLKSYFHLREYKGVHAVFLMTVLRIADYLQIQAERAAHQMLKVKTIRSPFSRREWAAHRSVDNIGLFEDDPEAIFVKATPPDVDTFLRLKGWLAGIQEELDSSWAVLGEIYGRLEELRPLGLVIRRVRSNLDDARSFGEMVEYVPRRIQFNIARSEILKLLIRPLYGDRPEVGIRELLQNSVDAVRELWDLQEHNPQYKAADLIGQEADVVIWLDEPDETGLATFTISDRGVGMTEEIITDYFLKVGASYRHSEAWAKQHEHADAGDGEGSAPHLKSRVLRSGRFGIGVLAAFLLGDEIEVSTRHATSPRGLRFTTRLDSEAIELRHDDSLRVGTTLRTRVSAETYERLTAGYPGVRGWDWYCLDRPSVLRLVGRAREPQEQEFHVPDLGKELPAGWYEVQAPDFQAVHFSLKGRYSGLICNGLAIKTGASLASVRGFVGNPSDYGLGLQSPLISVFDPDGNLPLDLTRSGLTSDVLVPEITPARRHYILAYLLANSPTSRSSLALPPDLPIYGHRTPSKRPGISAVPGAEPLFFTAEGTAVSRPWNVRRAGIRNGCVLVTSTEGPIPLPPQFEAYDAAFVINKDGYYGGEFPGTDLMETLIYGSIDNLPIVGVRVVVRRAYAAEFLKHYVGPDALYASEPLAPYESFYWQGQRLREEWSDAEWVSLVYGEPGPPLSDAKTLAFTDELAEQLPFPGVAEWFFGERGETIPAPEDDELGWEEVIGHPVIPYDPEERRKKLARAYEFLAPYLEGMEPDAGGAEEAEAG